MYQINSGGAAAITPAVSTDGQKKEYNNEGSLSDIVNIRVDSDTKAKGGAFDKKAQFEALMQSNDMQDAFSHQEAAAVGVAHLIKDRQKNQCTKGANQLRFSVDLERARMIWPEWEVAISDNSSTLKLSNDVRVPVGLATGADIAVYCDNKKKKLARNVHNTDESVRAMKFIAEQMSLQGAKNIKSLKAEL